MTQKALSLDSVVRHAPDVLFRNLDGEAVIVDLKTGTYFGLDPVGTCIWAALQQPGTLRRALEAVLAGFDVKREVAEPDLLSLAGELRDKGLLELLPDRK